MSAAASFTMAATDERTTTRAAAPEDHHHHSQAINIPASLSPPPFSATVERDDLERLFPSTTTTTTTATATMTPHITATFVPTAVPIENGTWRNSSNQGDDDVTVVAIATSVSDDVSSPFHPLHSAGTASASVATTASSTRTVFAAPNLADTTNHTASTNSYTTFRSNPKVDYGKDAINNILVAPEAVIPPPSSQVMLPTTTTTVHQPRLQPPPRTNLRAANVMGTISSEYEIADVARAQRQVRHVLQEQSELAVQVANAKAAMVRETADEGLTVDGRIHHAHYCDNTTTIEEWKNEQLLKKKIEEKDDEDVAPYGNNAQRNEKRGYEVQQYNFSEYDPKGHEYEVSEYKSVYD